MKPKRTTAVSEALAAAEKRKAEKQRRQKIAAMNRVASATRKRPEGVEES